MPESETLQLSVAVGGVHEATGLHCVISAGQPFTTGFSLSFTTTLNEQEAVPHSLVAVAVTVVVPTGKNVPELWEYVTVGTGVPVTTAAV